MGNNYFFQLSHLNTLVLNLWLDIIPAVQINNSVAVQLFAVRLPPDYRQTS